MGAAGSSGVVFSSTAAVKVNHASDNVIADTITFKRDQCALTLGKSLSRASTTLFLGFGETSERRFTRSRVHTLVLQQLQSKHQSSYCEPMFGAKRTFAPRKSMPRRCCSNKNSRHALLTSSIHTIYLTVHISNACAYIHVINLQAIPLAICRRLRRLCLQPLRPALAHARSRTKECAPYASSCKHSYHQSVRVGPVQSQL